MFLPFFLKRILKIASNLNIIFLLKIYGFEHYIQKKELKSSPRKARFKTQFFDNHKELQHSPNLTDNYNTICYNLHSETLGFSVLFIISLSFALIDFIYFEHNLYNPMISNILYFYYLIKSTLSISIYNCFRQSLFYFNYCIKKLHPILG